MPGINPFQQIILQQQPFTKTFFFTIDLGNVPDYIPRYLYLKYTEYYSPNNFEGDNCIFKIVSFQQSQFITHSAILAPYMSVAIEE